MCVCVGVVYFFGWWHQHYVSRSQQYREASAQVASESCTNATLNQQLGTYGESCRSAHKLIQVTPMLRSLYDVLEDCHICGHNRCELFFLEMTGQIPYISAGLVAIAVLVCRFCSLRKNEHRYELPKIKSS